MSQTAADRAAATLLPPTLTGTNPAGVDTKVQRLATSNSAARQALGLPSTGKYYITIGCTGIDAYVAFKKGTAAATVTTTTGYPIPLGQERSFWIIASQVNDLEAITSTGSGFVYWFQSSPTYEDVV